VCNGAVGRVRIAALFAQFLAQNGAEALVRMHKLT
jgi:hypothetical protein